MLRTALARAMTNGANIPTGIRAKVAIESIKCATQLNGLCVIELNGVSSSRDIHVYGTNPKWVTNMRTFGEAGVVAEGKRGKIGDRGLDMMFVWYPGREHDSCRMWNRVTNRVVVTRDVIWLKRMFYERDTAPLLDEEASDDEDAMDDGASEDEEEAVITADAMDAIDDVSESVAEETVDRVTTVTRSGRSIKPPARLIQEMSATQTRYLSQMLELDNVEVANLTLTSNDDNVEFLLVGAGIGGGFTHTSELKVMNYRDAMASADVEAWKVEVGEEKKRFDRCKALSPVVLRSLIPRNAKVMTTVWAMKKKTNGKLRGRLNVRGYEQRDGEHYFGDNISAPVTNANSVRISLTLMASNPKWVAEVIDVEGAFLQGEFTVGEEMYIEIPDGFESYYEGDTVLCLNIPIYGSKQAAACFYNTLVSKLKERSYQRSHADPCFYYIWHEGRLSIMISWVEIFWCLASLLM